MAELTFLGLSDMRQLYPWYESQVNELQNSTSPEDARAVYIALQSLANSQDITLPIPALWRGMIEQICGMEEAGRQKLSRLVAEAVEHAFPGQAIQEISRPEALQAVQKQRAAEKIRNKLCAFFQEDHLIIRLPTSGKDWGEATKEEIQQFKQEITT